MFFLVLALCTVLSGCSRLVPSEYVRVSKHDAGGTVQENADVLSANDFQSLRKYMFWLAEYNPAPTFTYDFEIWQYSCDGRVDGISGPVDLNMSFEIPDTSEE